MQHARADGRLQFGTRPLGDDAAVVDHGDAVGELVGLFEVLRRQQHGRAAGHEEADDLPDLAPAAGVEAGRRLVEEEEVRRAEEARGDVEPPPHAAGERLDLAPGGLGEVEGDEQVGSPPLRVRPREAEQAGQQHEVLHPRQVLVHGGKLPGQADPAAHGVRLAGEVVAEDDGAPGVGPEEGGKQANGRGLAGAVGPEEAVDGPGPDAEVETVYGPGGAEGLDEAGGLDGVGDGGHAFVEERGGGAMEEARTISPASLTAPVHSGKCTARRRRAPGGRAARSHPARSHPARSHPGPRPKARSGSSSRLLRSAWDSRVRDDRLSV